MIGPALRTGYVVGPVPVINQLAGYRSVVDGHGDRALEYALAELMEEGEIQRHIRRVRREYGARRDILADALRTEHDDAVTFDVPAGGTALWARVDPNIDVDAWAAAARAHGVIAPTGATFTLEGRSAPFLRLGFAPLDRAELVEAARRLAIALP